MDRIPLAMVGCGGMGHRHLFGLHELEGVGRNPFDLVGACDPNEENARSLADEAEKRFGRRPAVVGNMGALAAVANGTLALDICADPRRHHTLATEALGRGWHVMVEKPMGLTAWACRAICQAADGSSAVLSVAENYRRDPINRLARALLDAGAVGTPRLLVMASVGGGDRIFLTPWRHQKDASGLILDVGVHYGDMMEFFLGEAISVYAQTRLYEPVRYRGDADRGAAGFYGRWPVPEKIDCTAEDAAYAVLTFASGAVAQYTEDHAGRGQGLHHRLLFTSTSSLDLPNDRSGRPIRLTPARGAAIDGDGILDLVPDFRLDETTAALFGGDRLWRYDFPFPETDRKIIAIEYHDFGTAIREGHAPEVTADLGARAVAIAYAMLESGVCGQAVTVADVMSGKVDTYQREIDAGLK